MDKGQFIRAGYTVEPGDGGSFIVAQGGPKWRQSGMLAEMRGFSNYVDLMRWLNEEHSAVASEKSSPAKSE